MLHTVSRTWSTEPPDHWTSGPGRLAVLLITAGHRTFFGQNCQKITCQDKVTNKGQNRPGPLDLRT